MGGDICVNFLNGDPDWATQYKVSNSRRSVSPVS